MNIGVIGTGYVGLVQGVVLSEFGMNVVCMDIDDKKIDAMKKGVVPIYEPGLQELMVKNMKEGRLEFTTDIKNTVTQSDVIFIVVGTPPDLDGSADLQFVSKVAQDIGKYINSYKVIVNKSTVPVGTGALVKNIILKSIKDRKLDFDVDVVSNPEFLREGKAVDDCLKPDRIVIGTESEKAIKIMKQVYDVLYINQTPFVITNIETSEMIKYAANAFLAVKISFINEMALLSEKVGADVQVIAKAMGMDGRISPKFLHAGPGYGGSCFPKDTRAIADTARHYGDNLLVVEAAIQANEKQKLKISEKIIAKLSDNYNDLSKVKVAIWGLSFKPETDDMREAPAITIIQELIKKGIFVNAFCPKGIKESKWRLKQEEDSIKYYSSEFDAVEGTDALIIMTEWNQFRGANLQKVYRKMAGKHIFDLRNIYSRETAEDIGFIYYGVGR